MCNLITPFYKTKTTIFVLVLPVLLYSCEKVIHVDLNEGEKKYVIEAVITDQPGTAKVLISQTKNFDEDNSFTGISGAAVSIIETGGGTAVLNETSAGVYQLPGLVAVTGKNYTLSVVINGKTFTATCTMPAVKVNLDTVFVTDELLFTDSRKIVNVEYKDPPGKGNNYRFIQYVNGAKEDQVFIQNDDYTNGRTVNTKLFFFNDNDSLLITHGDTVAVDMQCIDPAVYKYWFSLDRSATGISGQATPSNPVTNMQGGALGYFSAHTLQTKIFVVP
jgi:hypothetical protein